MDKETINCMKKNNKKSFSQRAQDLVKRFTRASFDANEKKELDAALQKLSEEQELYKQVNKIGEYSDEAMAQKAMQQQQMMAQQSQGQFPQGQPQIQSDSQVGQMMGQQQEMPQFAVGVKDITNPNGFVQTNNYDNIVNSLYRQQQTMYNQHLLNAAKPNFFNSFAATGKPMDIDTKLNIPAYNTYPFKFNAATPSSDAPTQPAIGQDQQIGQTQSILPSIIAGGIGMLGNIALGAGVKEHTFNQSYGADQISLAKERERLSREATTARNIGMRNLSGAGSRGAYLAGAGNVSAGVNQQLGDALSQSYFKEGMTNIEQREKADALNRQVAMMNYQAKVNAENERRGYLAAVAGAPGKIMADIGNINYQNAALLSSGTDNYLAGTNTKFNPFKSQQIMRKFNRTDGGNTGVRKVIGYTADGKEIYNKK